MLGVASHLSSRSGFKATHTHTHRIHRDEKVLEMSATQCMSVQRVILYHMLIIVKVNDISNQIYKVHV